MEKKFLYQSFNIRFRDIGTGTPVLLLHGFGEDSQIWDEQVNFLKNHCRLLVPDLPGSGDSLPIGPDPIMQISTGLPSNIELMAGAFEALLANEGIDQCILLGHSMGGYITLAFAEKYPGQLLGFGLIHSSGFKDSLDKQASRKKGIEFIRKNGGFEFLQTAIPGLFSDTFKEEQPGVVAALIEQFNPAISFKENTDATLVAYYNAMIARPDRTAVLRNAKTPVLFVIGGEDKAVSKDDTLQQVHLPSESHVHLLDKVGHMSMREAPGLLNQYLLKFIEDVNAKNKE